MKIGKKEIRKEHLLFGIIIVVSVSVFLLMYYTNNPMNLAIQWIIEEQGGYAQCGMETATLSDFDFNYVKSLCDSANGTKYVFSYKICGRCPGWSCTGFGDASFILTNDIEVLTTYYPERPDPISYCKEG